MPTSPTLPEPAPGSTRLAAAVATGKDLATATRREAKRTAHRLRIAALARAHGPSPEPPVFVLGAPRTGTFLLLDLLDSLPGASFTGEVLSEGYEGLRTHLISQRATLRHVRHSLDALGGAPRGAKLIFGNLEDRGLALGDLRPLFPEARFVVIHRRSVAEQFVSWLVARSTQQWRFRGSHFTGQVEVVPEELRSFRHELERAYDAVLADPWVADRGVSVSYEDLVAAPQQVFDDVVLPFLGLASSPVSSAMVKQGTRPLVDVVANHAEVAELLDGPLGTLRYPTGRLRIGP